MAMKVFVEFYKQRNCVPQGISFENVKNPVYRVYVEDLVRVQWRVQAQVWFDKGRIACIPGQHISLYACKEFYFI